VKRDAAEILKRGCRFRAKRGALAASLLESLDTEVDEDAEVVSLTQVNAAWRSSIAAT